MGYMKNTMGELEGRGLPMTATGGRNSRRRLARRVLSLLLILNLLMNAFPISVFGELILFNDANRHISNEISLAEGSEIALGGDVHANGVNLDDAQYAYAFTDRQEVRLSSLIEKLKLPLLTEDVRTVLVLGSDELEEALRLDQASSTEQQDEPLSVEAEDSGDYIITALRTFDRAGIAIYTDTDMVTVSMSNPANDDAVSLLADKNEVSLYPDGDGQGSDAASLIFDDGGDQETDIGMSGEEAAAVYSCRFDKSGRAKLSKLMKLAKMPIGIDEVQQVVKQHGEGERSLSVEPRRGDFLIVALRDFDEANLILYTSNEKYILSLKKGRARASKEASDTPEEISLDGEADAQPNDAGTEIDLEQAAEKGPSGDQALTNGEPAAEPTEAPVEEAEPTAEPTEAPEDEQQAEEPTAEPTAEPTETPEVELGDEPAAEPTAEPTEAPEVELGDEPAAEPTAEPTEAPEVGLGGEPAAEPTAEPTEAPEVELGDEPAAEPTAEPTEAPEVELGGEPSEEPTAEPTEAPEVELGDEPAAEPTAEPTEAPAVELGDEPTAEPTEAPEVELGGEQAEEPTAEPTEAPAVELGGEQAEEPTAEPTEAPAVELGGEKAAEPTAEPTEEPAEEAEPTEEPAEAGEPSAEPTEEPVEETEPTEEPAEEVEPSAEPTEEPAEEDEPTEASIEAAEPTAEPTEEPAEEAEPTEASTEAPVAYPAQTFTGSTARVRVTVTADEGAFPEGTTMTVKRVWKTATLNDIAEAVSESDGFAEVLQVQAVDITFFDADGNEIEPLIPVSVVMTVNELDEQQEAVVVHVDDAGEARVVEQSEAPSADGKLAMEVEMPAGEPAPTEAPAEAAPEGEGALNVQTEATPAPEGEGALNVQTEATPAPEGEGAAGMQFDDAEPAANGGGTELSFEADGFSVYAVVTVVIRRVLECGDGESYLITVEYDKDSGIPANAALEVTELAEGSAEYDSYVEKAAEALGKEVNHLAFAHAFDIKLVDPETGEHYQPTKDVKVSIDLLKENIQEGDSINVVHFPGTYTENPSGIDGEALGKRGTYTENPSEGEILAANVHGESVEFESDSFSIYVVAADALLKRFIFLNGTDTVADIFSEQALTTGEGLVEAPKATKDGAVFKWWSLSQNGPEYDFVNGEYKSISIDEAAVKAATPDYLNTKHAGEANWVTVTDENVTKSDMNEYLADHPTYLYAVYNTAKTVVTFYNQSGLVIQKVDVYKENSAALPAGAKVGSLNTGDDEYRYTPIQDVENAYLEFKYWTTDKVATTESDPAGVLNWNASEEAWYYTYQYDNNGVEQSKTEKIMSNDTSRIDLYPVVVEGHYLNFDTNKAAAGNTSMAYISSQFVENKDREGDLDTVILPAVASELETLLGTSHTPTVEGYTFLGWYTQAVGGDQVFAPITSGTNAGKLDCNESALKGLLDVNGKFPNNPTVYAHWDKVGTANYTVVIWKEKLPEEKKPGESEYAYAESFAEGPASTTTKLDHAPNSYKQLANNVSTTSPYYGFEFKTWDTDITIDPSGKTVVNVYYSRIRHRLTFVAGTNGSVTYYVHYYGTDSGNYYVRNNNGGFTQTYCYYYGNDGNFYTKSYGRGTKVTPFNQKKGTVVKTIEAPYGAYIGNLFPIVGSNGVTYDYQNGTGGQNGTGRRWQDQGTVYPEVIVSLETMPNETIVFGLDEISRPKKIANYYIEALPGTTESTVPYESKIFVLHKQVTMGVNFFTTEDAIEIVGMQYWKSNPAFVSGSIKNVDTADFYYTRHAHEIKYYDVFNGSTTEIQPTNNDDADTINDAAARTVLYDQVINESFSKFNDYPSTELGEPHYGYKCTYDDGEGHTRYRWYIDEGLTTRVFFYTPTTKEIESTKDEEGNYHYTVLDRMPEQDALRIYLGWTPNRYQIKIIPDKGELGGTTNKPNSYSTYFKIDHGEKITEYKDVTRDYINVGEGLGLGTHAYELFDLSNRYINPSLNPPDTDANEPRSALYTENPYDVNLSKDYVNKVGAYIFLGWYEAVDNNGDPIGEGTPIKDDYGYVTDPSPFDFNNPPNRPVTLVAKWQRAGGFYVRYDIKGTATVTNDDGTTEEVTIPDADFNSIQIPVDEEEYAENAHALVLAPLGAPHGYTLDYWYNPKEPDKHYQPNELAILQESLANLQSPSGHMIVTLKAHYKQYNPVARQMADYTFLTNVWTIQREYNTTTNKWENKLENGQPISCDPYFNGDDYREHEVQKISVGEELKPPITPEAPDGYEFKGWYYDKEGTRRFDGFGVIAHPVYTTLYAVFTKVYKVNYYLTDIETGVKRDVVLATQSYSAEGASEGKYEKLDTRHVNHPIDPDHYIDGWTSNGTDLYSYNRATNVNVTRDLDLYAKIVERKYVKFDSMGGSYVATQEVAVGGKPIRPEEPKRTGYKFKGWTTVADDESSIYNFTDPLPNGKDTLYALWEADGVTKADITVIWWAQTAEGGSKFEMQKSITVQDLLGQEITLSRLNTLLSAKGEAAYDNRGHLEKTAADSRSYFECSESDSDSSIIVDSDQHNVFNIRFIRTRYTFEFYPYKTNTLETKIYYKGGIYTKENPHTFTVWIGKDIENEWPVISTERQAASGHPKASYDVSGKQVYWEASKGSKSFSTNTMVQVVSEGMLALADDSKTVKWNVNLTWFSNANYLYIVRSFLGDTEYVPYTQIVYRSSPPSDSEISREAFDTAKFGGRIVTGYSYITESNDPAIAVPGGYNRKHNDGTMSPRLQKETVSGGKEQYTYTAYSYSRRDNDNTTYYVRTGFDTYRPISFDFSGNSTEEKNSFEIKYNGNATWEGDVYYVESGATPYDWGWPVTFTNATRLTWDGFKNKAIKETTTIKTGERDLPDGDIYYVTFYYKKNSYDIHLMMDTATPYTIKVDGEDKEQTVSTLYDTYVPQALSKASIPNPPVPDDGKHEGMVFDCWSEVPDAHAPYEKNMPANDIYLYATWKPIEYTVTTVGVDAFANANDTTHATNPRLPENGKYPSDYGQALKELRIENPKRDGAIFTGWQIKSRDKNGNVILDDQGNPVMEDISENYVIKRDTEIFPKWSDLDARTIVYNANVPNGLTGHGTAPVDSNQYVVGAKVTIMDGVGKKQTAGADTPNDPSDDTFEDDPLYVDRTDISGNPYEGTFAYWNTKPDGSGQSYYPSNTFVFYADSKDDQGNQLKTLTLYAIYSEYRETTLTYNINAPAEDVSAGRAKFVLQSTEEDETPALYKNKLKDAAGNFVYDADGEKIDGTGDGTKVEVLFRDIKNSGWEDSFKHKPNDAFAIGDDEDVRINEAKNPNPSKFTVIRTDSYGNKYIFAGWSDSADPGEGSLPMAQNGDIAYVNTIDDLNTNVLYAIWGLCKIQTDEVDRWGVTHHYEHLFSKIQDAVDFVNSNPTDAKGNHYLDLDGDGVKTATIEMLIDYHKPNSDAVTIPDSCNITLTTAKTGVLCYLGTGNATITRAQDGGSMFVNNGTFTVSNIILDGGYSNNTGKTCSTNGGLISVGEGGTLNIQTGATLRNSTSTGNGGAISTGYGASLTLRGDYVLIENCSSVNGGAIHVESSGSVLNIEGGTINGCTATGNGGGVCVTDGTLTITGGSITGNTATNNGGAVYVASGASMDMSAGTIGGTASGAGNTAAYGGGVYNAGTLTLSGSATITGNKTSSATVQNGGGVFMATGGTISVQDNVQISGNTTSDETTASNLQLANGTSCLTVSGDLTPTADIRISNNDNPEALPSKQIGTESGVKQNLNRIISDVNAEISGMALGTVKVVWSFDPICKLTDKDGNLLYMSEYGEPAIFATLNDAVTAARRASGQLYTYNNTTSTYTAVTTAMSTTNSRQIKMLRDYTIDSSDNVTLDNANDNIVITTAEPSVTSDMTANGDSYTFSATNSPSASRTDADGDRAILGRGWDGGATDTAALFYVNNASATLTTQNIILDGKSKVGTETEVTQKTGRAVYVNAGSLSIGKGATLRSFQTPGNGGAIYSANGITVSGASNNRVQFLDCNATSGDGGAIYTAGGTDAVISISNADFEDCFVNNSDGKGGAMYFKGGAQTLTDVEVDGVADGHKDSNGIDAKDGGGIYLNAGNLTLTHVVLHDCHVNGSGGGIYMNGGTLTVNGNSNKQSEFKECAAPYGNGGAIYNGSSAAGTDATVSIVNTTFDGHFMHPGNPTPEDEEPATTTIVPTESETTDPTVSTDPENDPELPGHAIIATDTHLEDDVPNAKNGGAIYMNAGTLSLGGSGTDAVSIKNCTATLNGGAIYNASSATSTATGVTVKLNTVTIDGHDQSRSGGAYPAAYMNAQNGGAIFLGNGTLYINGGTIQNCRVHTNGGAIYNNSGTTPATYGTGTGAYSATVRIDDTILKGFSGTDGTLPNAENGGAIFNNKGRLRMNGGRLLDFKVTECGGAIYEYNVGVTDIDTINLQNVTIDGHARGLANTEPNAQLGGAIYTHSQGETSKGGSIRLSGCEILDCVASSQGGAIFNRSTRREADTSDTTKDEPTVHLLNTTIDGHDSLTAETANADRGGAILLANGTMVIEGTSEIRDCIASTSGGAIDSYGSGTQYKGTSQANTADDYTVKLLKATIENCSAGTGHGGAIYVKAILTMTDSQITGCTAGNQGGAVYVRNDTTINSRLNMSGGNISGNSSTKGGAVEVESDKVRLNFSGDAVVYGNPASSGDQKNVVLSHDSNGIINTTSAGLGDNAHIGVYVAGAPSSQPYSGHGTLALPFGTDGATTANQNLEKFQNDIHPDLFGVNWEVANLFSTTALTSNTLVYWGHYICKIEDSNQENTANGDGGVKQNAGGKYEHPFFTLNHALAYARAQKASLPMDATHTVLIQMLVDYEYPANDLVSLTSGDNITLTTATKKPTSGSGEEVYYFTPTFTEAQGRLSTDSTERAIIKRGSDNKTSSMFTVASGAKFATGGTRGIIFDGGAKFDNSKWGTDEWKNTGVVINSDGGIINNAGTLDISEGTILRNSAVGSGKMGGAVSSSGTVSITGTSANRVVITDCQAQTAGAVFTSQSAALSVSYATFQYGKAEEAGFIRSSSTSCSPKYSNCIFEHGKSTKYGDGHGPGAVDAYGNTLELISCQFTDCFSGYKGGAFYQSGTTKLTVEGCYFTDCWVGGFKDGKEQYKSAGAFETSAKDVQLTNCSFTRCTSNRSAGAVNVYQKEAEVKVQGCTFEDCFCALDERSGQVGKTGFGGAFRTNSTKGNTFTDCTFTNCYAFKGGAIGNENAATITIAATDDFINAGKVCFDGCAATGFGGAVYLLSGTLNIQGGTMQKCYAPMGGGVYQGGGTFNFSGGTISQSLAAKVTGTIDNNRITIELGADSNGTYYGGGVYLGSGTFTMDSTIGTGGTISQCNAVTEGGGVYLGGGSFSLKKGSVSQCNAKAGGGIYANVSEDKTVAISALGDVITGCNAKDIEITSTTVAGVTIYSATPKAAFSVDNQGGGIYQARGTLNISNGVINGCTANTGGGIYLGGGTLTFSSGAVVRGSTATASVANNVATGGNGGGIYLGGGELTLNSGTAIKGNTATASASNENEAVGSGGGIYLEGTGTLKLYGDIGGTQTSEGNSAVNGGGVYQAGGTLTIYSNASVANNSATNGSGGGINLGGGTLTINKDASITNNTATGGNGGGIDLSGTGTVTVNGGIIKANAATAVGTVGGDGGGIYLGGGTFTFNSGTVGGSRTNSEGNSAVNGGGIYQGGGKLTMNGGNIKGNTASANGGGVYLGGGDFTLSKQNDPNAEGVIGVTNVTATNPYAVVSYDQSAEGNSAYYGGGLYVADGVHVSILGGKISGNRATYYGGGIYAGGNRAKLFFAGSIQVFDNYLPPSGGKNVPCDVCLDYQDSEDERIINTTAPGLNEDSHIGVYVTDKDKDVNGNDLKDENGDPATLYDLHGKGGKPFGRFKDKESGKEYDTSLNRFINNRSGSKYESFEYYYGVRKAAAEAPNNPNIYWAEYICEITDVDDNLLFTNTRATAPALYQYLGHHGAFDALGQTFYDKEGNDATPAYVKMLVNTYDLKWEQTVDVPAKSITLTMCDKEDGNYSGTGTYTGYCAINRGNCTTSMFTTAADSVFTLENVIIDGGAVYDEETDSYTGYSASFDGALIKAGGSVTLKACKDIDDALHALLQNSVTTTYGGAIAYVGPGTLTLGVGSIIEHCKAANGGVLYVNASSATEADPVKVVIEGGAGGVQGAQIKGCTATNGLIYAKAGTLNLNSPLNGNTDTTDTGRNVIGCSSTSGGLAYVNGGSLNINGAVSHFMATNGGAVYVEAGTLNVRNEISYCTAPTGNGGGVYIGAGTGILTMDQAASKIDNCTAKNGGAIFATGNNASVANNVSISAGEISANEATEWGGGALRLEGGAKASVSGDAVICGNKVTGEDKSKYGGAVNIKRGKLTISGGTISGNFVKPTGYYPGYGGAIHVGSDDNGNGELEITGGTIMGNYVESAKKAAYGGAISMFRDKKKDVTASISGDAVISGNYVTTAGTNEDACGGAIAVLGSAADKTVELTLSQGTVSGNRAASATADRAKGAGIYVKDFGKLKISGSPSFGGAGQVTVDDETYLVTSDIDSSGRIAPCYVDDEGNVHYLCVDESGDLVPLASGASVTWYQRDDDGQYYRVTVSGGTVTYLDTEDDGNDGTRNVPAALPLPGNFPSGNLPAGKVNGGQAYSRARQDIYIVEAHENAPESIVVAGDLTGEEGSIWVWAESEYHYRQLTPFAKLGKGISFVETSAVDAENKKYDAAHLKIFRDAQDDDTAENGTDTYLYGTVEGDSEGYVYWSGVAGFRRVILRKVGNGYEALKGAKFNMYRGNGTNPYVLTHADKTKETMNAANLVSLDSGILWIGTLPYGTYYLEETQAPSGYAAKWFYCIFDADYQIMSEGYANRDAAKAAATTDNDAIKLARQIIVGKLEYKNVESGMQAKVKEMLEAVGRGDLAKTGT